MGSPIFWIIFSVCIVVCVPILIYYAKRSPNPRFRPRVGELFLAGLLMVSVSFGVSLGLSAMFGIEDVFKGIDKYSPSSGGGRMDGAGDFDSTE